MTITAPSTDQAQVTRPVCGSFLRTFVRFSFLPLSPDPLSNVRRTVFDLHVRLALSEKDDRLSLHQVEVLQVQDDPAAACFCFEQPFQFAYTFNIHSTAHSEDHFSIRRPCDP